MSNIYLILSIITTIAMFVFFVLQIKLLIRKLKYSDSFVGKIYGNINDKAIMSAKHNYMKFLNDNIVIKELGGDMISFYVPFVELDVTSGSHKQNKFYQEQKIPKDFKYNLIKERN